MGHHFVLVLCLYVCHACYACALRLRHLIWQLSARWITTHGFSIGISDVTPSPSLSAKKKELVDDGYRKCDDMIQKFHSGTLAQQAGCDIDDTLEAKVRLTFLPTSICLCDIDIYARFGVLFLRSLY